MNALAKVEGRELSPEAKFQDQWARQEAELALALPPHIPVERFMRVVRTAVAGDPALLLADRRSLFEASMKAAQDGLLPDGRDGALVIFNAKVKEDGKDVWIKKIQWMPMVGGILKKVRNSGELVTIAAHVVYENDHFEYQLGDEERIDHKPKMLGERGKAIGVYAVAKTKDGGIYREVMSLEQVEKVRGVSRAKDSGPWKDWWDEMAKKTVIRRLAKRLPMSSDLDDLIRRDDDLYDFQGKRAEYEGMHQRLAPTARERLEAAKQDGGAQRTIEGFNRAEMDGASGQSIDADGQGSFFPSDDTGSASSQAAADAGEGDGKAEEQAAPSPDARMSDADLEWLRMVARRLWAATAPKGERGIFDNANKDVLANHTPDTISQAARDKAESIWSRCLSVITGKGTVEQAKPSILAVTGLSAGELGGDF